MTKREIIDMAYLIISSSINIIISFVITSVLGITNIVLLKSYSAIYSDITWEVLIFFALSIISASIYELYSKKFNHMQ